MKPWLCCVGPRVCVQHRQVLSAKVFHTLEQRKSRFSVGLSICLHCLCTVFPASSLLKAKATIADLPARMLRRSQLRTTEDSKPDSRSEHLNSVPVIMDIPLNKASARQPCAPTNRSINSH